MADAFEIFLKDFKTSPEQTLANAMGEISIEEDDLSDEYDFMDEDEGAAERRRQEKERHRTPQYKYKDMMQQLANREIDEIRIDLDDLETVSIQFLVLLGIYTDLDASGRSKPKACNSSAQLR